MPLDGLFFVQNRGKQMQDTLSMREIVGFVERKLVYRSNRFLSLIIILLLCIVSTVSEK